MGLRTHRMRSVVWVLVAGALALAGCGGDETGATAIIRTADGVQVISAEEAGELIDNAADGSAGPADGDADGGDEGASGDEAFDEQTANTVAVADDRSPDEQMFDAFNEFRACLTDRGTEFIGAPDPSGEGPTNDPAYRESLGVCAQQSDIVAAMEASREASEDLTPEQVQERNEGVLVFVDCMEGRGWTVEVTTAGNGLITPSNMAGPNGESLFDSSDLDDCAGESQDAAEAAEGES